MAKQKLFGAKYIVAPLAPPNLKTCLHPQVASEPLSTYLYMPFNLCLLFNLVSAMGQARDLMLPEMMFLTASSSTLLGI